MDLAELDGSTSLPGRPRADRDDEAPEGDEAPDKVLTLGKLPETVVDDERPFQLAIQTKHPTRYGGLRAGAGRPAAPIRMGPAPGARCG